MRLEKQPHGPYEPYLFSNRSSRNQPPQFRPDVLTVMTEEGRMLLAAIGEKATNPAVVQTAEQLQPA